MINNRDCNLKNCVTVGARAAVSLSPVAIPFRLWGFEPVNPTNFLKLMKKRQNILLVPGGFEEATITSDKEYRLFIKNRKGFIKYAI